MALGGAALKLFQTILYAIEFCCAGIILGIYSYFLSVLADRDLFIATWIKAVTGLAGAAVLYTIFAVLLTCFLGGKTLFAFLGIIFDILFVGAMVAIAVLTRDGAHSCSGFVNTPLGDGQSSSKQGFGSDGDGNQITYAASLGSSCRLNSACFAVAIAAALLFLVSALVQLCLGRIHKKEKRYGPSPSNGYTKGSGVKFFGRKHKNRNVRDAEMAGAVPAAGATMLAPGGRDYRPSHDTAYTGSTVAPASATYDHTHKPMTGGYHTAPTGTYNNATPATNY
ncbi:hypothetical protein K458DRAFT_413508 [Lentithecium fluviatile CBS 122367]|uniref:MARVEL domain-containing protein n=1 Tax=Lentithecium fluviatile CBS 122367 TaxID=1168545 RepID=A0A6G1JGE5_9PLEO|nr:hypothetical protein K458DRAFT_413508 [Lentithecium fluviatile CBS 122367]